MSTLAIVGIDVILLIVLLMLSVPLPYCFGGALMFMALAGNVSMKSMMLWGYSQSIGTVLLASPLFIIAGTFMGGSGVAKRLLDLCDAFIGRIKGGLGIVSIVTCAIIGAISGSGFTGVAATGPIMIPRMEEQGSERICHSTGNSIFCIGTFDPSKCNYDHLWMDHRDIDPGMLPFYSWPWNPGYDPVLYHQSGGVQKV